MSIPIYISHNVTCMQEGEECQFLVHSSDHERQYTVKLVLMDCQGKPNCLPQCTQKECVYLCRHMVSCNCYDYQHGHLCKHTHRVHNIYQLESGGKEHEVSDDEPKEIGVTPSTEKRNEAGILCLLCLHALHAVIQYMQTSG